MNDRPARVMLYVQHLLGIGHLKRAMTLARALADGGLEVTVVSGGTEVPQLTVEGVRIVQLPPVSAADVTFKNLVDGNGAPIDERWKSGRRDALFAAYREVDPQVLLIELFPFGRRQMRFELVPLLDAAISGSNGRRPLIVSSVRDIGAAGQREPSRRQLTLDLVGRYIDRVLVHSDPALIRFEQTFAWSEAMAPKLHYTGFVVDSAPGGARDSQAGKDEVLVSAGGGAVGRSLLETALRARPATALRDRTWRLLTGIGAPDADIAAIEALAARTAGRMGERVVVERTRDDFTTLLRNCAVSISQAGYNTTMEILDAGTRAVLVPFAGGAETEQSLRAGILAEQGRVEVVDESALTPATLAAAVDRAAGAPVKKRGAIDLGGAQQSARLLTQWVAENSW